MTRTHDTFFTFSAELRIDECPFLEMLTVQPYNCEAMAAGPSTGRPLWK